MVNILAKTDAIMLLQQQGYKIELAELLKRYLQLFPDVFKEPGKIIKSIGPQTPGLIQPQMQPGGGQGPGQVPQQFQAAAPNNADIISGAAGEKGQGIPIA
jgi:hypothetical protein